MSNGINDVVKMIEDEIDRDGYSDIGTEAEERFDCKPADLRMAVKLLEERGYKSQAYKVQQIGTDNVTKITVLHLAGEPKYKSIFDMVNKPKEKPVSEERTTKAADKAAMKENLLADIYSLKNDGMSNRQIAQTLNISESTIRSWLVIDKVEKKEKPLDDA